MIKRLSPKHILLIHDELIEKYGGSHGVRDKNLLESAIFLPNASYGGVDLYPTIIEKAAVLLRSLVKNHPFVDGNKRTAIMVTQILLEENGYCFKVGINKTFKFVLRVANENLAVEEIVRWLEKNVK